MTPEIKVYDEKMLKTIEVVKANYASVRAGRANAAVLDRIQVEYYGSPTPLNQVAAVASPDPRVILILLVRRCRSISGTDRCLPVHTADRIPEQY